MKILGIDPGFERLGIAVLESPSIKGYGGAQKNTVVFSECFKTSAKLEFAERLKLLGEEVQKVIKKYKPEVLAIETLFLTTNQKTVMHVAEARGVVIYEAIKADLKIFEASPPQIKIATTGYGKADKEQVMRMVKMLVDIDPIRGGPSLRALATSNRASNKNFSDDEMDAIAIAITGYAHLSTVWKK